MENDIVRCYTFAEFQKVVDAHRGQGKLLCQGRVLYLDGEPIATLRKQSYGGVPHNLNCSACFNLSDEALDILATTPMRSEYIDYLILKDHGLIK